MSSSELHFKHALVADNSSGVQFLEMWSDNDFAYFRAYGTMDGLDIHLDFQEMNPYELDVFIYKLYRLKEMMEKNKC